jgi:nitrate/TMAO reductase-like tetraheme cytochrome c subunit
LYLLSKKTLCFPPHTIVVVPLVVFCLVCCLDNTGNVSAATYSTSAHGNTTSGVYNRALDGNNNSFGRGNCAHCHDQHASRVVNSASTTHTPNGNLGFLSEEILCLDCHDGSPATDNIDTDINKSYGHGSVMIGNSGRHLAGETSVSGVSTSAHVECTDCHNPHMAQTGNHDDSSYPSTSVDTTQNDVSNALLEVDGVSFSSYPTNWSNATSWSASGGANSYAVATKEYQICFKCHSSANGSTDGWDGNPGGAGEWTDLALEFNPANASYHPVLQAISSPLNSVQLIGVDHTWKPGSTMYCSDCHASDASVAGPHGSATKWMLVGTYKNWPYTSASDNGGSSGTYAYLTAADTTFCRNCHVDPSSGSSNNVHGRSDHQSSTKGRCINCHIRVPHGGKGQRLINANNGGTLPDRYYPDGNGGDFNSSGPLAKFLRESYHNYGKSDCRTNASNCNKHASQNPSTTNYW